MRTKFRNKIWNYKGLCIITEDNHLEITRCGRISITEIEQAIGFVDSKVGVDLELSTSLSLPSTS